MYLDLCFVAVYVVASLQYVLFNYILSNACSEILFNLVELFHKSKIIFKVNVLTCHQDLVRGGCYYTLLTQTTL